MQKTETSLLSTAWWHVGNGRQKLIISYVSKRQLQTAAPLMGQVAPNLNHNGSKMTHKINRWHLEMVSILGGKMYFLTFLVFKCHWSASSGKKQKCRYRVVSSTVHSICSACVSSGSSRSTFLTYIAYATALQRKAKAASWSFSACCGASSRSLLSFALVVNTTLGFLLTRNTSQVKRNGWIPWI